MILTLKQTIALDCLEDSTTKEVVYGGAAGGGKSRLGAYWLLKNCIKYPGSRWLMGRAKLKTLKETTYKTFLEACKAEGLFIGNHFKVNNQSNTITFFNGSEILMKDLFYYPSDPDFDELGSLEITGAFIDEVNQIVKKAWDTVKSRIRYMLDEFNLIPKILGTCNPAKNWVYDFFYSPSKKNSLPSKKKFIQSLVTDNPHISRHYIENLQDLGLSQKNRLLKGLWEYEEHENQLISFDSATNYFNNSFIQKDPTKKYITVDVARLGKDKSKIRVWYGWVCIEKYTKSKMRITKLAQEIRKIADNHLIPSSEILVDEDGVGGGVVDILECKGFVAASKPLLSEKEQNKFINLRSQVGYLMAKKISENQVYEICEDVDEKEVIKREMEWVREKNPDKDGAIQLLGKDDIKKEIGHSPDDWDSIALRYWFELTPNFYVY